MTDGDARRTTSAVETASRLYDVAHASSGDKGDIVNITVVPYSDEAYPDLVEAVTVDRVKNHFGDLVDGDVERYLLPNQSCLNFVLHDALDGGVTRSLRLDPHGKTLSSYMLLLPLEDEP